MTIWLWRKLHDLLGWRYHQHHVEADNCPHIDEQAALAERLRSVADRLQAEMTVYRRDEYRRDDYQKERERDGTSRTSH